MGISQITDMAKDYYKTLGVSRTASEEELKKAYRKLAHEFHPDKKGGNEAKFKEINEAYQTLSNKEKRAQYDRFGESYSQFGGGGSSGNSGFGGFDFGRGFEGFSNENFHFEGGFDDIFSDVFGSRRGGGARRAKGGADIQIDVEISFEEMASGTKKSVPIRRNVSCSSCDGTGGARGAGETMCSACNGAGKVRRVVRSFLGAFEQVELCETCSGRGKSFREKCQTCRGSGRVARQEKVDIEIPAGIEDGQALSLSGGGEAGERNAPAGDLLIVVHVRPHASLTRRGNDIFSTIDLSCARAALGDTVEVSTIDGAVSMKIPPGTQSGEVFRIRGKGLRPMGNSWGKGDHLVTVAVRIPKRLSGKERALFESLRDMEG